MTTILGYLGAYGNCFFIICSAWFLIDSNKVKMYKVCRMLSDVWIFSVISLGITFAFFCPPLLIIIKSLMPNAYGLYWFITCYAIFYVLHPALNSIEHSLPKKELLQLSLFLFVVYFVIYFLVPKAVLYYNYLLGFCCIYIILGYLKLYLPNLMDNFKINVIILVFSLLFMAFLLVSVNFIFLRISPLTGHLKYFSNFNNGIIFLTCMSCFNVFRIKQVSWVNNRVNYLSSLTLLVYIIHENYFYANYCRHLYYDYIFDHFGVNNIFFFTLLHGLITFIVAYMIAILYDKSIRGLWYKLIQYIYNISKVKVSFMIEKIEKM